MQGLDHVDLPNFLSKNSILSFLTVVPTGIVLYWVTVVVYGSDNGSIPAQCMSKYAGQHTLGSV